MNGAAPNCTTNDGAEPPKRASSIRQFCSAHEMSTSYYYVLRERGQTPREIRLGRKVIITDEAAADWRREMEELTAAAEEAAAVDEASGTTPAPKADLVEAVERRRSPAKPAPLKRATKRRHEPVEVAP